VKDREKEYKEIFIAEALQEHDDLSRHIVSLEKNPDDDRMLAEIFRLLHNLKANAKAIGFLNIAEVAHNLESVFGLIRNKEIPFKGNVVTVLFDGIDYLGLLLKNIDNPELQTPHPDLIKNLERIISGHIELMPDEPLKKIYTSQNISLSDLIYIQVKKLDDLMNLVGELIIDRDRIISLSNNLSSVELKTVSSHLERITNELQFSVMDARLVNIGSLFNKFPRIVRDVALTESKDVALELYGQDIQIDRNILQIITDALLHIMRNAITHGIESKEERKKEGKSPVGHLELSATTDKDIVVIEIRDDGKGIDVEQVKRHAIQDRFTSREKAEEMSSKEILSFIFEPGFSLSKEVTELSGRGVGLDVVKNALDAIGGRVEVDSKKGEGTTFRLLLPTSIAVKGALLFEVNETFYAVPLIHTESVITISPSAIHSVGSSFFVDIKGETVPTVYLSQLFDQETKVISDKRNVDMIIVTYNNRKLGFIVDRLLRQQDIVVKPLQRPVANIELFGGVTLLGSGEVCLVLDIPAISKYYSSKRDLNQPELAQ
jgi:two-component system chemotaxis sensor kinase CheA